MTKEEYLEVEEILRKRRQQDRSMTMLAVWVVVMGVLFYAFPNFLEVLFNMATS